MSKRKQNVPEETHGKSSKFGQLIGNIFADQVIVLVEDFLQQEYPEFVLLRANEGQILLRLEMMGGTARQIDTVIVPKGSRDPLAVLESKWLKDARHHNDKGAWILQLREIRKKYPTVRGAAAILAGYWTEGVGLMFKSEGGVEMVLVATDEEIYQSLQQPVNLELHRLGLEPFIFDARQIRKRLPRTDDLLRVLSAIQARGELATIAETWFKIPRQINQHNMTSGDVIRQTVAKFLQPFPEKPQITTFEIALQLDTGNTIYCEFTDAEEAMAFIQNFSTNPQALLDKIRPKLS